MARHILPFSLFALLAMVVAMLVTPADPLSVLLAFVPIFALTVSAYFAGVRSGRGHSARASDRQGR